MTTSLGTAYINGKYCPIEEAAIPLLDWGFTKSDATYDVVGLWEGRFFRLEAHIDRFMASIDALEMTLPVSRDQLREILAQCVRRSNLENAYVSMTCTRGKPPAGSRDLRKFQNALYVYAIPYVHIFNQSAKGRSAHLYISDIRRIPAQSVDPKVKNYHWLDLVKAQLQASDFGADLPVLVDAKGNVTEGFGFNLFAVLNGVVVTPRDGVLEGVTRQTVFDLCGKLGMSFEARDLSSEELATATEIFATSTAGGIMPVGTLNGRQLGDGEMGAITTQIHNLYWEWHFDPSQTTLLTDI
jgi:branched-chain amino acid aminotransferase